MGKQKGSEKKKGNEKKGNEKESGKAVSARRNQFLSSLQRGDVQSILSGGLSETQLSELLEGVSVEQASTLFHSLAQQLTDNLQPTSNGAEDREDMEDRAEFSLSRAGQEVVDCCVVVGQAWLRDPKRVAPASLLELVSELHEVLFLLCTAEPHGEGQREEDGHDVATLQNEYDRLANGISVLCETWWHQDRPGKEELTPQTISYLLVRCLQRGRVTDVLRLYQYRAALLLIDFLDESSSSLKRLMLRCAIHPLFLRNKKGLLLLVYFFGLFPPFIEELHGTIKSQLPTCRKSLLEAYGEVYFKAWKGATGAYLLKIEYSCIQDLMNSAVHCSYQPLGNALRKVLDVFHKNKKQKGVDRMLLRLYEPILWRSLRVANAQVRRNSAALFVEAFPIQDPDNSQRDSDSLLQKQFSLLETLLFDDSVAVRCVGVSGTCRILSIYWELIPDGTIRTLVSHLVNELIHDASSSIVRSAVIEGIEYILDNHLSQPLFKSVLMKMSHVIHDNSEHVRLALVRLLLFIKKIKFIRFYDIVPIDHLLHRLANDTPAMQKQITTLLLNSYFPFQKSSSIQVTRSIVLLNANKAAAVTFYKYAAELSPLSASCKLAGSLFRYLCKNSGSDQSGLSETDLESIAEIICTMFGVISPLLKNPENSHHFQYIVDTFDEKQLNGFLFHGSPILRGRMLQMSGVLPSERISSLSESQLKSFLALQKFDSKNIEEHKATLECLLLWGFGDKVLEKFHHWLSVSEKPKKSKQTTVNRAPSEESRTFSLLLLNHALGCERIRLILLAHSQQVMSIMGVLLEFFLPMQKRLYSDDELELSDDLLLLAFTTYCKLVMHISACFEEIEKDPDALKEVIKWTKEMVVPKSRETPSPSRKRKWNEAKDSTFLRSLLDSIILVFMESIANGLCSSKTINDIAQVLQTVTTSAGMSTAIVFRSIFQLYREDNRLAAFELLKSLFQVHVWEAESLKEWRLEELLSYHQQHNSLSAFVTDLGSIVLDSIEVLGYGESNKLPDISMYLCTTLRKSKTWTDSFSHFLSRLLIREDPTKETVWKVLCVVQAMASTVPKGKKDDSSLTSLLMGVLSKLPEGKVNMEDSDSAHVHAFANRLLQSLV